LTLLAAAACNQVFDIQEAHVDPALASSGGNAQTSGGNAGQGGSDEASGGLSSGSGGTSSQGGALGASGEAGMSGEGGAPEAGAPGTASGGASVGSGGTSSSAGGTTNAGGKSNTAGTAGTSNTAGSGAGTNLCVEYCNTVTSYCTGENLQYKDLEQCLKICEYFPKGTVGGPDDDTVACRLKYAGKARYAGGTELAAYCRQGGAGGDGRCGSNCEGFCDITQVTCNADETAPYFYPSRQACENSCASLPDIPFVYGSKESADGNSVQCRLFHVMSAAMADAGEHCAHVLGVTLCEPPN
jgi:hypothetical protein